MLNSLIAPLTSAVASDLDLARRAVVEPAVFAALYRRYLPIVYRYLMARLGSVQEAEDLAAQTFDAALHGLARYDGRSSLATWLIGIARHKLADHLRRLRPTITLDGAESVPDPVPNRALELAEVFDVLRRLPPERAELLTLRFYAGLSVAECAQLMGRSEGAIKMLTYRAIQEARGLAACQPEETT